MDGKPIHSERHMRVVCVGAGASGLCLAYKLQRSFQNFSLTIYEKNADVGGVWFQNRYPGCECDYEAHNYTYSWEPNPDWPQVYASAKEIRGYFGGFASKYGLYRYCKFNHRVLAADWAETQGVWKLTVRDSDAETMTEEFDIFVNATGILSTCKWPDIPHLDKFQGAKMHSGAWDESIDLAGKRVCLVGNGSSGQQILKAIQPIVGHLTVIIRQPTWLFGPFGEAQRVYSPEELERHKADSKFLTSKRKQFEGRVNSYFGICLKDSPQQAQMRVLLTEVIRQKLLETNSETLDASVVVPGYAVGCRRPTPGVGYIEALASPNVSVVTGEVTKVTKTGVVDNNNIEHAADILIFATGFDASHRPPFPVHGSGGKNLQELWRERATAYLALAAPDMPNYFVFSGPNNPYASGSYLVTIEAQADYMLKMCDRWQTENILSFAPKKEVVQELQEQIDTMLARTIWSDSCSSWYKPHGRDTPASLWPGSGLHYMEAISTVRTEDYDFQYQGNRFGWLGNGVSQVESDPDCDPAFYVREKDDSEMIGKRNRRRILAAGERPEAQFLDSFGPREELK
ncbi:monooxygenase [Lentithecium fluviatile CBS 122367]|uniref:Monooxygenase n=1 Tax=Lentithecium fluviatile CBS 122367 TaxID=1168545 RepID=A0A6G1IF43_9PLEO|nr:monooxygenase [Lentithecium fluviatile CBS 122367]